MKLSNIEPRLLDRDRAAAYLSCSVDTVDRLLQAGAVHAVRLPAARHRRTGRGVSGACRRILLDRCDLDELIERWKEA